MTHARQGREFLRHLRRTRMVLHVVDVVQTDPLADYLTVRDELRMYNPEFVRRPHVVALNKADVLGDGGAEWMDGVRQGILAAYDAQQVRPSSSRVVR
jgi:GTPase involved in cell partitioning and DNA repair